MALFRVDTSLVLLMFIVLAAPEVIWGVFRWSATPPLLPFLWGVEVGVTGSSRLGQALPDGRVKLRGWGLEVDLPQLL